MNGSCAGGTGAFIDQMATLLQTDASGLNQLAMNADTIYPMPLAVAYLRKQTYRHY